MKFERECEWNSNHVIHFIREKHMYARSTRTTYMRMCVERSRRKLNLECR